MTTSLETIRENGVATVWMNRPEVHNVFDEQVIAEITQVITDLNADGTVGVIVLAGRGRNFSAGGDLAWMQRAATYEYAANLADARNLAAMLRAIADSPKTTIARVQGLALGGGTGLVAACDIAVASTTSIFATSEVKFGLIPATIAPYVLRAIGPRQALRYFQSAERIDADRAYEIGLVHEVVAPDQLDAKVAEIIAAVLTGGPQARAAAKQVVHDLAGKTIDAALIEDTAHRIADVRATDEARAGIDAFFQKRPAPWVFPIK